MPILKNKNNDVEVLSVAPEGNENKKETTIKRFTEYILEVIKVVLISLAIIVPVRYFLIQPFYVKGASMEPNFFDHEYLIINEISYRFNAPERGDIVVFKYPRDPSQYFIKRIIGLPNETLEIKDGKIMVYNSDNHDGLRLEEDYLEESVKTFGDRTISLGSDEYFIMGDNRLASFDSRSFGPIKGESIVGKVWVRGWPFNKIKVFETPEYNRSSK
ncbi:signal peptidase I [Patescibacteria group bacterium]|nr:signal peptidase I [Patescibacteria group bacterium]